MKLIGMIPVLALCAPVGAFAAPSKNWEGEVEYVVPVNKQSLKPFSKFFVSRFRVTTDENGSFNIRLTLPRDLTGGQVIDVDLVETERQGNKIKFTKDIGNATCEVPADWNTAKCTYVFNENFKEEVPADFGGKYLERKYAGDPSLPARKEVVVDSFLKSTEPVGEAFPKPFNAACQACVTGNGVWNASYVATDGNSYEHELTISRKEGRYFHDGGAGTLTNIQYQGNVATGRWNFKGSEGWFRFVFSGELFTGQWGMGALGNQPKGPWTGTRVSD